MPIGNPIQKNNDTRVISATATTGQTDFTVTGGYTINAIGVFRNGVRLNNSTDFTAADGSTVTLNVAADAGDTVTFHIFDKFTVANAIVGAASTQTVYGNLAVNGELYSTNFNPTNLDVAGIGSIAKAIIGTGVTIDQSNIDTVGLISATTFTGNLVGNVTGDVTGSISGGTVAGSTGTFSGSGSFSGDLDIAENIRHIGDTNTKISFSSADTIQLTTGGTARVQVDDSATTLNSDVSIADKIIHTGDTNTAIRFPAADTITAETGGSERLRITSAGKVGIGTDNPGTVAHLLASDCYLTMQASSASGNGGILFKDSGGTQNSVILYDFDDDYLKLTTNADTEALRIDSSGRVLIGTTAGWGSDVKLHLGSTGNTYSVITSGTSHNGVLAFSDDGSERGAIDYDHNGDHMLFKTAAAERLRITSDGRLLIGGYTTASIVNAGGIESLNATGHNFGVGRFVASAVGPDIVLAKSRNATLGSHTIVQDGDLVGTIKFRGSDGGEWVDTARIHSEVDGTPGDDDMPGALVFSTTADGASSVTERLRIESGGDILLNNTDNVIHTSADTSRIRLFGGSSNSVSNGATLTLQGVNHSGGNFADLASAVGGHIQFRTGTGERMRITSGGEVVVGGTSSQASDAVTLMPDGEVTAAGFYFSNNIGSAMNNTGIRRATTNTMVFDTDSTERLRIDSSGRILIADAATATNTPMETFGSAILQLATTAGGSIVLGRNDTSVAVDNNIGVIQWDCNDSSGNAWNDVAKIACSADGTHGDGDYPSRLEFYTTADGAATVTERIRVHSGGTVNIPSGITLGEAVSSTAASNTLDDYEEGTFTPNWQGSSTGGTTSYGTYNIANYTKIGNIVTCRGYTQVTNSDGAGAWQLLNLPFTGSNSLGAITTGSFMLEANFVNAAKWMNPYKNANTTILQVYYTQDNGSWSTWGISDDVNWNMIWGITYQAA